eukprot:361489-Chlamydomonas_euryale.AAC.3
MPGDYPREGHKTMLISLPRRQGHRKIPAKCKVVMLRSGAAHRASGPTRGKTKHPKKGQGLWSRAAQGSRPLPRCTWYEHLVR